MNNESTILKRKKLIETIDALNHLNESIFKNNFLSNQEVADKACEGKLMSNLKYLFEREYPDCLLHFSENTSANDTIYFADFSSIESDNKLEISKNGRITWQGKSVLDVLSSSDNETEIEEICEFINYADRYVSMTSEIIDSIAKEHRNKLLTEKVYNLETSLISLLPQVKIAHLSVYPEKNVLETIKNRFSICCPDYYLGLNILSHDYCSFTPFILLRNHNIDSYDSFSLYFNYHYSLDNAEVSTSAPTLEYRDYSSSRLFKLLTNPNLFVRIHALPTISLRLTLPTVA